MNKLKWVLGTAAISILLGACGSAEEGEVKAEDSQKEQVETAQAINYLGNDYEVPNEINTIITASLEAMEDAAVLNVKPAGVISSGGADIPSYLAKELEGATVVGNKREPNSEKMLSLNPDIILGTSKWDEAQMATYNKIAVTFPYSHISANWRENLLLFGQLAGKEQEAESALADYDEKLSALRETIQASDLKDKKVLMIRVRGGLGVYPKDVYFNPSLYEDLGLKVPEELLAIEAQTELTYETLAEWAPDVILLQFSEEENQDNKNLINEITSNAIFNSTPAAKNNEVYTNIVNPMAQGGTAWSKIHFLNAFVENVVK